MPVDNITFFFLLPISSNSGRFVISPDGILKIEAPNWEYIFRLQISKQEAKNLILSFLQ